MKVTIGVDPEFFLKDKKTGKNISAHDLIPGSKDKPHKLDDGACQLDGTAVEFNTAPAASSFEFSYNISSVVGQIRGMIPDKYAFDFSPAIQYDLDYWGKIPQRCKELGCDPDYDATQYNPEVPRVPKPLPKQYETLRTGAGHIHIGWTKDADPLDKSHFWDSKTLAYQMYALFKVVSPIWDTDDLRPMLYGSGAAFRPKSYGVEFRSPSNAWMRYPNLWPWIFEASKETFNRLKEGNKVSSHISHSRMDRSDLRWNGKYTPKMRFEDFNALAARINFPQIPADWAEVN